MVIIFLLVAIAAAGALSCMQNFPCLLFALSLLLLFWFLRLLSLLLLLLLLPLAELIQQPLLFGGREIYAASS